MHKFLSISLLLILTTTPSCSPFTTPLMQSTCKVTGNYTLCISTLNSTPNSLNATNIKDLSKISLTISLSYASNSSDMLNQAKNRTKTNDFAKLAICAQRYRHAVEALQMAVEAVEEEEYEYATVHVGAAREYPGMCRALFKEGVSSYPLEIARRQRELEGLCQLSLDIVSLLLLLD